MAGTQLPIPPQDSPLWRGLPGEGRHETTAIEYRFQALDNFSRSFAFKEGDRLLMLTDRLLDPRVTHAIIGLARAKGIQPMVLCSHTAQHLSIPDEVKPLLEKATTVVSTWFCSVSDPFAMELRSKKGQRWVKITYFRNLDLLDTPQARFPIDLLSEIIRAAATRYPKGRDFDLRITDPRGSDFKISFDAASRDKLLSGARWRGVLTADEPGCYQHYLPTHGPNLIEADSGEDPVLNRLNGVYCPQWAIGFAKPFSDRVAVEIRNGRVSAVEGKSEEAKLFRDMLMGGFLGELGCGFNPKAPRFTGYPAGSNSPGAIHFGIDFPKPSNYIRKVMPDWEEPPIHMDLMSYDATVTTGKETLIDGGFLTALRDQSVIAAAQRFGDPVDLLEGWPD